MILSKKTVVDADHKPTGEESYWFWCPGCESAHQYRTGPGPGPRWNFNGSMDKPSFTPSLLNTNPDVRCHLYMTDGRIQFLSDCHHELAGQTVEMVPVPEWLQ